MSKFEIVPHVRLPMPAPADSDSMQGNMGIADRFHFKRMVGRNTSQALAEQISARVQAEKRIGLAQIAAAEAAIKGQLTREVVDTTAVMAVDIITITGVTQG